jgi:hypothetical protein
MSLCEIAGKRFLFRFKSFSGWSWILLFLGMLLPVRADEPTWEYAVQVSATVQSSPPRIILSWPQDVLGPPANYVVYRKAPSATAWGTGTTLSGATTTYVDSTVSVGTPYEYQIIKNANGYTGSGYIVSGINVPLNDNRGKLILIVDNTFTSSLANELNLLQQDLVGDGWTIIRHDVPRNDSVQHVKSIIKADYNADPTLVRTVFLFGHVPVPYSGNIAPDDHIPQHQGAWPCDAYYGDMDGTWTDNSVNSTGADDGRNYNYPGDGKFDQSTIPSSVELMVGRVDLANMPGWDDSIGQATFPSELELLRNYIHKEHNYRHKTYDVPRRALIHDSFGVYNNEAFAASGWRNFAPFFGADNILYLPNDRDWISTLSNDLYLWAYGCGPGTYTSISGLGYSGEYNDVTTTDIVNADAKVVFAMVFGSWLGDWDSQDNLMKAFLATKTYGLACVWSGSPHWFAHNMGVGTTIGYTARLTQNNSNGLYRNMVNHAAGQVHVALMGDPSLHMFMVSPVSNLTGSQNGSETTLYWNASPDDILGYHVYRADDPAGPYMRLTSSPITDTSYTDVDGPSGAGVTYMVRAVKLETTSSGSYYNGSQGIFWPNPLVPSDQPTVTIAATDPDADAQSGDPATFTFTRTGNAVAPLTVNYDLGGTATKWNDYRRYEGDMPVSVDFPAGAASTTLTVYPIDNGTADDFPKTIVVTLSPDPNYTIGSPDSATATISYGSQLSVLPTISVLATQTNADRLGASPGVFTFTRADNTNSDLVVHYAWSGTATTGIDFLVSPSNAVGSVLFPAGMDTTTLSILPQGGSSPVGNETVTLSLLSDPSYNLGSQTNASINISGNTVPHPSIQSLPSASVRLSWASISGKSYHIAYKNNLNDPSWTDLGLNIQATNTMTAWPVSGGTTQRYYCVFVH